MRLILLPAPSGLCAAILSVAMVGILLVAESPMAMAQARFEAAPPPCGARCQQLRRGESLRRGDFVDFYNNAAAENATTWWLGQTSRYAAAALSGGASALKTPVAGAVVGIGGRALEDLGTWAVSEYHEAVRSALVIEADRRLQGRLIDPKTGAVRLDELEASGGLAFLTSPEVWNKVGEEERPALEFARGNLNTILNVQALKELRLARDKASSNNAILRSTFSIVTDIERTAKAMNNSIDTAKEGIKGLTDRSDQQTTYLKTLLNNTNLPPREKLALSSQGLIELRENERRMLLRAVDVEAFQLGSAGLANRLGDAASKLQHVSGIKPEFIANLNQASSIFNGVTGLAAAYVTQDYLSMGLGVMSVAGQIGSFGKKKGPSPEQAMLVAIMQQLQELNRKIDAYHAEEMAALEQIARDISDLRSEMMQKFGEVETMIARLDAQLETLLHEPLNTCYALEQGYETYFSQSDRVFDSTSLSGFADWVDRTPARINLDSCRNKLEVMLASLGNVPPEVPEVFLPLFGRRQPPDIPGAALERKKAVVADLLRTTREYMRRYDLGAPKIATLLRTERVRLTRAAKLEESAASLPPASDDVVWITGPNLIDPGIVLKTTRLLRMVAGWQGLLWDGTPPRGLREEDLEICTRAPASCRVRDPRDWSYAPLRNASALLQRLVEQEQVAAGAPVIQHIARSLESDVVPAYAKARAGNGGPALQQSLTREAKPPANLPDTFHTRYDCATGLKARDALCLMQANPIVADNAIALLVAERLKSRGRSLEAYESALRWSNDALLRDVLGDDLSYYDSSLDIKDERPYKLPYRHWVIELPRVFTAALKDLQANPRDTGEKKRSGNSGAVPQSCWHERGSVDWDPYSKHWHDALDVQDADVVGDPRWARCYSLPNPETLRQDILLGRDGTDVIWDEIGNMRDAMAQAAMGKKTGSPSDPKVGPAPSADGGKK